MPPNTHPPSTRPGKLNSFALYLMSLALVIGLYSVYLKYLVPVIEGPPSVVLQRPSAPNVELPESQFDRSSLAQLLPGDAWETGECKTLVTAQGTILFKRFERIEGGYLEVLPFTLLTSSESEDSTSDSPVPPTVLRCLKGARLKFDDPDIDPLSGKSKMESAWLVGPVDISRAASGANSNDAIAVSTSNVQIDKQRVFTIDPVQFQVGNHRGSGRNLVIDFDHAQEDSRVATGLSSVKGIRRIELAFLDHLRLETPPRRAGDAVSGNEEKTTPINVTCEGPFVFDFEERTATFREGVVVEIESKFQDEVRCDRLALTFDDTPVLQPRALKATGISAAPARQWELKKLTAEGTPAIIFSSGRAAKVTGGRLSYDVASGEVLAEQNSEAPTPVTVVSPEFHVTARRIAYAMRPGGEIGPVEAVGPGSLLRVATEKSKELFVEWQNRLNLAPSEPGVHSESGIPQVVVSLDGDCKVRLDSATNIRARKIQIWLNKIAVNKPAIDRNSEEGTTKEGSSETAFEYQPDKIIALHDVEILSEQLNGTTEKLTAVWQGSVSQSESSFYIPSARVKALAASAIAQAITRVRRPPYRQQVLSDFQRLQPPPSFVRDDIVRDAQVSPTYFAQESVGGGKKYSFGGKEVNVRLVYDQGATRIEDLTASGNVVISEVASAFAESDAPPLKVTGSFLRCVPQAGEQVRILVTGTPHHPAAAEVDPMRIQGQQIHLDQTANKLWIEGAGSVRMENAITSRPGQPPSSSAENGYEQMVVNWSGGMVFDGSKVYFEDAVKMEARGKDDSGSAIVTRAAGEGLSLRLNRAVDFGNLKSDADGNTVEIREVVIVDRIVGGQRIFKLASAKPRRLPSLISHQTLDSNGNPVERQKFLASQVTFNVSTGVVNAKGPGAIMIYRRGDNRMFKGRSSAASNQPMPSSIESSPIQFIRVNFDGAADANTTDKQMVIRGNIRTLYTGVESYDQVLDPDVPNRLPDDSVRVTCEQLKLVQWTPRTSQSPTSELLASGNAHIVSGTFEATADRVSYSQATDMLVVEGTPRSDANLWFKQTPQSKERDHLVAGKILYRLSDQWTEVQSMKNVNINRK